MRGKHPKSVLERDTIIGIHRHHGDGSTTARGDHVPRTQESRHPPNNAGGERSVVGIGIDGARTVQGEGEGGIRAAGECGARTPRQLVAPLLTYAHIISSLPNHA